MAGSDQADMIEEVITDGAAQACAHTSMDFRIVTTVATVQRVGALNPIMLGGGAIIGEVEDGKPKKAGTRTRKKAVKDMSSQEKFINESETDLLAWMKLNPTHIPNMWAAAKNGDFNPLKVVADLTSKKERWPATYLKLWRFPDYFVRGTIRRFRPECSEEDVLSIQNYDATQPWQVLIFCTGLNRNWNWSVLLHDKDLLDRVLDCLYMLFGRRIEKGWWPKYVKADGSIDWENGGVMRKKCDHKDNTSQVTSMEHCSGETLDMLEAAKGVVVDKAWPTHDNYSDLNATTKQGMFNPTWVDQFGEKLKPLKKQMTSQNLEQIGKQVDAQMKKDKEVEADQKSHHDGVAMKKRKTRGNSTPMLKDETKKEDAGTSSSSSSQPIDKPMAETPKTAPPPVEVEG
jgi:hypothetical protein